jgi:hypothetical protein
VSLAIIARSITIVVTSRPREAPGEAQHTAQTQGEACANTPRAPPTAPAPAALLHAQLSGLPGLQAELPGAAGVTQQQLSGTEAVDVFTVTLPPSQLSVTEALLRDWAAAAAQLQVQLAVLPPPPAPEQPPPKGAKAAAAGLGSKGAAPPPAGASALTAAAPIAAGSVVVDCAGLLVGDTSAVYSWGVLPALSSAAGQDNAAGEAACTPPSAAAAADDAPISAALAASSGSSSSSSSCAGSSSAGSRFKRALVPPSGDLQQWLGAVRVTLQVIVHRLCHPALPSKGSPTTTHTH